MIKNQVEKVGHFLLGAGYILAIVAVRLVLQSGLDLNLISFGAGLFVITTTMFLIVSIIGISITSIVEIHDILERIYKQEK